MTCAIVTSFLFFNNALKKKTLKYLKKTYFQKLSDFLPGLFCGGKNFIFFQMITTLFYRIILNIPIYRVFIKFICH